MKYFITTAAFTLLLLFFSPNLYGAAPTFTSSVIKPAVRVEAPAFALTSLDGGELTLPDFKGKVILLNFWATWCAPCKDEIPGMERLWQKLGEKNFVIIAIAQDRGSPKVVKKFSMEHNITFPILLDPTGRTRRAYEVTGLPTSYIVGKDGKLSGKVIGIRAWDSVESEEFFEELLDKKRD